VGALTAHGSSPIVEWAVAGHPIDGEVESGDLHVVAPFDGGVLVGAVDGLGHGPAAATASRTAVSILSAHAGESPIRLMDLCDQGLQKTRGAVMTLASIVAHGEAMTWTGIGNVEAILLRADPRAPTEGAPMRGGIVGFRMPAPRGATITVFPGDTLVLATDGIAGAFSRGVDTRASPAELAEAILAVHGKRSDDAMVVVARYVGHS
jgi:phosphoserine phosphatase RsbX